MSTVTQESSSPRQLPGAIWALGFVSLLMDVSSEAVHGILPVYLVTVLGASVTTLGLLEGIAEAAALALKVVSGPLSDFFGRRKPLVVLGYTMGALSKPIFALATSVQVIFAARVFDRIGKGIRGAPRDALIADLSPPELRGAAYGLRQSLDTVGAFLGPVLAIAVLHLLPGQYTTVFWLAAFPGFLAVLLLVGGVREQADNHPHGAKAATGKRLNWRDVRTFKSAFWVVTTAGAFFQLARFSEAFLILRTQDLGLPIAWAPLVLIAMNIVYALTSYPLGRLSDRMRKEWFLGLGFLVLVAADLCLAFAGSVPAAFAGICLWGLHLGLTQGVLAAMIADTCPPDRRGTAFGLFNLFSALALLLASLVAGIVWQHFGPTMTFLTGGGIALISAVLLAIWTGQTTNQKPQVT